MGVNQGCIHILWTSTSCYCIGFIGSKKTFFLESYRREPDMEGNEGSVGTHVGEEGTVISSRPSGDVDMEEGQDQETVPGLGTHLDVKWSHRSSGRWRMCIFGHHDTSSLLPWNTVFCSHKQSTYLVKEEQVDCTCTLLPCTSKKTWFLCLVPFTTVSCGFEGKNMRIPPQNFVLRTFPAEVLYRRGLSSIVLPFSWETGRPTQPNTNLFRWTKPRWRSRCYWRRGQKGSFVSICTVVLVKWVN